MSIHRVGMILLAASLAAACYSYEPLPTPTPAPGLELAATLTDSGSAALTSYLGPTVSVVRGRYIGPPPTGTGLLLAVEAVETVRGEEIAWAGERVTLPTAAIAMLQVRHLSKGRSVLFVGVGAAGLAALVGGFSLIGSGSRAPFGLPPGAK